MKLIENQINDMDAWLVILGHCNMYKRFSNPQREDSNPSAVLFRSRNGNILLHDFVDGTFNWKSYLKHYLGYTINNIHNFIRETGLKPSTVQVHIPKLNTPKDIRFMERPWSKNDDKYWGQYNITEGICKHFDVYPVSYTWLNNAILHTYINKSPVYVYKFGKQFKIYAPYHKCKWLSNLNGDHYQGFDQLPWIGDILIITKSMKDVMTLYSLGYNAIAPHSENCKLSEEFINNLYKRFNTIYLMYDNDSAGHKAAIKVLEKFKTIHNICIDKEKDISDYIKHNGVEKTTFLIKEQLL